MVACIERPQSDENVGLLYVFITVKSKLII